MAAAVQDAVVVVTGASSGIGRAAARAFAERGARVVVSARSEETLQEVVAECADAGGRALAVATDVADQASVDRLAREAAGAFGRIDVWVNNAAVMAYGRFEDIPADVHRRVIDTNLFGQLHGARAVLQYFRRQKRGVLVNVDSLYAKMTSPYVSPYVASKYAVRGFSEVLRQELSDEKDIHVCTVFPGAVDTPIFRHAANYRGRTVKPVPPVSDPERVVRAILRCVDRPRREVTVGQTARLFSWGHALTPRLYERLAPLMMEWFGFSRDRVPLGHGNVFEPMPEWNRVSGDWRSRRIRPAAAVALLSAVVVGSRRMLRS